LCVGHPFDGVEVRAIAFTDGPIATMRDARVLPTGEIGELVVRGPHISPAYADDPDSTRKNKIHDPAGGVWHRLGDAGYLDDQGRVWCCGRAGHRVTTASGVLFPLMCEPIFDAHPSVRRSGLVGVGDLAVICVELVSPANNHDELRAQLLELAAAHVVTRSIRHVVFRKRLPVDPRHNSKIERPALAKWALVELRREQRWRPLRQLAATV
jgi:acyl-CoA synthetase (AMP-forming)/AMP-acid ligase II